MTNENRSDLTERNETAVQVMTAGTLLFERTVQLYGMGLISKATACAALDLPDPPPDPLFPRRTSA